VHSIAKILAGPVLVKLRPSDLPVGWPIKDKAV